MGEDQRTGKRLPHRSQQLKYKINNIIYTNTNTWEDEFEFLELDGDLLSVYGSPAIKYLERPWNKQRAQVNHHPLISREKL